MEEEKKKFENLKNEEQKQLQSIINSKDK